MLEINKFAPPDPPTQKNTSEKRSNQQNNKRKKRQNLRKKPVRIFWNPLSAHTLGWDNRRSKLPTTTCICWELRENSLFHTLSVRGRNAAYRLARLGNINNNKEGSHLATPRELLMLRYIDGGSILEFHVGTGFVSIDAITSNCSLNLENTSLFQRISRDIRILT